MRIAIQSLDPGPELYALLKLVKNDLKDMALSPEKNAEYYLIRLMKPAPEGIEDESHVMFSDFIGGFGMKVGNGAVRTLFSWVHKDFRRKGIFKSIMDFRIKFCMDRQCSTMLSRCNDQSLPEYLKRGARVLKPKGQNGFTLVEISVPLVRNGRLVVKK